VQSSAPIVAGEWTHVAGVYDGTGDTPGLSLYINGALDGFLSVTGTTTLYNNDERLYVGADIFHPTHKANVDGRIDDIAIYNRALNAAEIQVLTTEDFKDDPSTPEPQPVRPGQPYTQDFSSGKPTPAQGWEYYWDNEGRIEVVNGRLRTDDQTGNDTYSLNEAILHLDLVGQTNVQLTIDHWVLSDEEHSLPSTFTGHADGDGGSMSADGTTWYSMQQDFSTSGTITVDLDAAIESAGIEYTSDFQIKFQQYDNYPAPSDGRELDNVAVIVAGTNAPVVEGMTYKPTENTTLTVAKEDGVVKGASDVDGDSLTFARVSGPGYGSLNFFADGSFQYTANANFNRTDSFTFRANDGQFYSNVATVTLQVETLLPSYNGKEPKDVNDDDQITPADVLSIIEVINTNGVKQLSTERPEGVVKPFLDVNGDNYLTALDVLWVINYLNQQAAAGNGEGEASAPVDVAAGLWQPSPSTAHRTSHPLPVRFGTDSSVPLAVEDTSYWQRVDEAMGSFTGRQQRMFAGSSDRSAEALEDLDELAEQLVDEALLQFGTFQDGN
jgi:hypothetical protein